MKVGKEEIAGLMAALERYVERDHQAEWQRWFAMLEAIRDSLKDLPGVAVDVRVNQNEPAAVPMAHITFDEVTLEMPVVEIINRLMDGDPGIAVSQGFLQDSAIGINPMVLQPGQEEIIASRIRTVVRGH